MPPPRSAVPIPATDRLQQAALWVLAAALVAVPLGFYTGTQDQFELPKQLLLRGFSSLLLGLLLAGALADGGFRWRRTPLDWPVLAWSLWLLVKTVFSVSPAVSWRGEYENFAGSLTQLDYSAIFFVTVQLAGRPDAGRRLARALLAGATGAALYALMQALQRDFVQWSASSVVSDRFFGPLGNPNFLAGLMAMAIPLKTALAIGEHQSPDCRDREGAWRWAMLGCLLLAYGASDRSALLDPSLSRSGADTASGWVLMLWLASLLGEPLLRWRGRPRWAHAGAQVADLLLYFQVLSNTGTRGGFLGLMLGALALVLGWLALRPGGAFNRRMLLRAGLALGLFTLGLGLAVAALGGSFRDRTLATLRDPRKALEVSRLEIWEPAIRIWKDFPLTGTGVDTFKSVFPAYARSRFNKYDGENVASREAHCEPLQVLSTEGLVGLALWIWLCAAILTAAARAAKAEPDPQRRSLTLGLGALAAAYLGQNLVSFGVAAISFPFWASAGLIAASLGADAPQRRLPRLSPALALALGLGLAGAGLWLDSQTLRADLGYAIANQAQGALRTLEQGSLDDCRGAASWALGSLDQAPASVPALNDEAEAWRQQLGQWEQSLALSPGGSTSLLPQYRQAAAALMMVAAARDLERSVALCPNEVKYQVYLGLCYEDLARRSTPERRGTWMQAAEAHYRRGTRLNPRNAYFHGNLGRLYSDAFASQDPATYNAAVSEYRRAIECAPTTRLFYENLLLLQAQHADLDGASAILDKVEAADKELAPSVLMAAAGTFFQWQRSGAPAWTPAAKAQAPSRVVGWARRAVALAPAHADYALALAVFLGASGQRAESAQWAHRALRLQPDNLDAQRYLKLQHY